MGKSFRSYNDAVKELRDLSNLGYDFGKTIKYSDYDDIRKFYCEQICVVQIIGRMSKRMYQLDATIVDFAYCYETQIDQKIDGEAFLVLAKCFKRNLKLLIKYLQDDLTITRTWSFLDRRVIKWVERWEDVCEFLKDYCEEMSADFFEE